MSTTDVATRDTVIRIADSLARKEGALMPVLHAVQDALGYIPADMVAVIAERLNLSRAEVHGVVTFYHYFRTTPPGRHTLHLCRAEACQAMNSPALERHAQGRLGIGYHETTSDGAFSLEPYYCLGNCALSPALMVDEQLYGRVTPERFDAIVKDWEKR